METPIIATDTPGCREVVENGINGLLCKVRDSDDLEKILHMLGLPQNERIEMGKRGREKIIREFDEKIIIKKYFDVIGEQIES